MQHVTQNNKSKWCWWFWGGVAKAFPKKKIQCSVQQLAQHLVQSFSLGTFDTVAIT